MAIGEPQTGTFKFLFSLDGKPPQAIKSIEGLTVKLDKVETRSNGPDGKAYHKVFAGNKVFLGQISATRFLTKDTQWALWYQEAMNHMPGARINGIVTVFDNEGTNQIATFLFEHALPIEYKITGMNASAPNPVEETVTFMYETLKIDNLITL